MTTSNPQTVNESDLTTKFHDERDKLKIDQLDKAVLQFSANCFETKKLCATVLVSVSVIVATFGNKQISYPLFIVSLVILLIFWGLDGYNYYYQRKLRTLIDQLDEKMLIRHEPSRQPSVSFKEARPIPSLFNNSMWFYYILIILYTIMTLTFLLGIIPTIQFK